MSLNNRDDKSLVVSERDHEEASDSPSCSLHLLRCVFSRADGSEPLVECVFALWSQQTPCSAAWDSKIPRPLNRIAKFIFCYSKIAALVLTTGVHAAATESGSTVFRVSAAEGFCVQSHAID